jgi:hypothetical protein
MIAFPPDSGGPNVTPDRLGPPDSTTVRCPTCRGRTTYVAEDSPRPAVSSVCPTCMDQGKIDVSWRSWQECPQQTHLFRVRYDGPSLLLADSLCPHDPVPLDQVTGPTGSPCMGCLAVLADLGPGAGDWMRWL